MLKFSLLATAVVSACAFAQSPSSNDTDLEHISVYASRYAKPVTDTLTSVTVFERADIEAAQVRDLPALLQQVPGITVSRQGGRGQTSSIFIRGGSSAHTLVLIDGLRVGAATAGYQSLAMLPLEQIEKIEIIRGPKAAMYGSSALGGVIAITSRRSDKLNFNAKAGSHGHAEANLAGSQQLDQLKVFGSVGTAMADGFNATTNGDPDDDGFDQSYVKAGAEYQSSVGTWLWQSQLNDGNYQYDSSWGGDQSEVRQEVHLAQWQHRFANADHQLKLGHNVDEDLTYGRNQPSDLYRTVRDEADWQSVFQLQPTLSLLGGLNYTDEQVKKTPSTVWLPDGSTELRGYADDHRVNKAVFTGLSYQPGDWLFDASGRRDYVSGYGGENSYQLGAGYQLTEQLQLRLGKATAFKVPSFNDLYWPGYENPDLRPEESTSHEAGLDYLAGAWQSSLVYFHRDLTNLIRYQDRQVFNVKKARMRGVEFSQNGQIGSVELAFNYSWLQADDLQKQQRLTLLPKHKAVLNLSQQYGDWSYGLTSLFQSRVFNGKDWSGVPQPDLPSMLVLGAAVSYQWDAQTKIQLKLDNLLDRSYQTSLGYRQAGLELMLGVQLVSF
jgi:vitamin B12 transporter